MQFAIKKISRFVAAASAVVMVPLALGQTNTSVNEGDWPVYHGNEFSQRYSPLEQINAQNVGSLQIAWHFSTENFGPTTDFTNPSTPLEINGVLYANIATTRNIVALDPTTGQVLWL